MYNRTRKYNYFIKSIAPSASQKILDIGFTDNDYSEEANYLEKHYPYLKNITALGMENDGNFKKLFPEITTVLYDGNKFPFSDNTFDIVWSNAVIEHVGDRKKQVQFIQEMLRTCKQVYFTTPNKYSPSIFIRNYHWYTGFPKSISTKYSIGWEKRGQPAITCIC